MRKLHPELQRKLDAALGLPRYFAAKKIPECVTLVAYAINALQINECGGNNQGHDVGLIQSIIGQITESGDGQPWCMSLVQCIIAYLEGRFGIVSDVPASEHCLTVARGAYRFPGLITHVAEPGSFWIAQHGDSEQGHTGVVLSVDIANGTMTTFEGNTSDSSIRDGDGAHIRTRNLMINGNLKTMLFVRVYPYNVISAVIP